jgi:TonB family protein
MTQIRGPVLSMLPERKLNWRSLAMSFGLQAVALLLLVSVGIIRPEELLIPVRQYSVMHLTGPPQVHHEPARPPKLARQPVMEPKVLAKLPVTEPVPHVKAPTLLPRPVVERAELVAPTIRSPKAPAIVKTGVFGTGSSAVPTLSRPAKEVQTGGFGDPNGLRGEGKPGAKLVAASYGSFDLPAGPGYGNGTGGARGARGTVASVGFGNGIATGNSNDRGGNGRGAIQQAGFGDARPAPSETARVTRTTAASPTTPVEILSKPKPVYTDEARQLRLEGEVLLEVAFSASGEIRVIRVLRGLGHGLDEAAMRAAQQIHFKPAKREGQPVDSMASLHVVFQLAY